MRAFFLTIFLFICLTDSFAQKEILKASLNRLQYIESRNKWVDSVFNSLSEEERIAQLFMIAAYSNKDDSHEKAVLELVKNYGVGGLIFFQGTPVKQAKLTNEYQQAAKVPLLIAMDAEWGLGMRLDSTISFPRQLTLGAHADTKLIYQMGQEIARQCKRLGVQINFAPVVDINSNPENPVINDRSFGEDKFNVALKSLAYMEGMQDAGLIACAKHFPGHGDTDSDSHLTLPVIRHSRERIDRIDLYPFKVMITNGVKSIMTAHIHIPSLDSTPHVAASLSNTIVTGLLKKDLGFEGLVFSDALNMKGVSNYYEPGEVDLMAFKAGNDVMLFSENVPRAVKMFKEAIKKGEIDQEELSKRVRKILKAKYEAGLSKFKPIKIEDLTADLNPPSAMFLRQQLYGKAMTLIANKDSLIPFRSLDTLSFASVAIDNGETNTFQSTLDKYGRFDHFAIEKNSSINDFERLRQALKGYNTVVVSLHDMSKYASKNYGISSRARYFIENLSKETHVVLTVFGSPYSLKYFEHIKWVLMAYEDNPTSQSLAAQVLFGGLPAKGSLPVTASENIKAGMGISTKTLRLKYSMPEEVGIESKYLTGIDSLALEAISDKATPGCQILVAKDGKVIYYKSFGYHTYADMRPVHNSDLYDLASITKVAATTLSLMRLYDNRQFQLNRKLSEYLDGLDSATVKNLIVRNILIHEAGLKSWIPFYLSTLPDTIYDQVYSSTKDSLHDIQVAQSLYIRHDYTDTIYDRILYSEIDKNPEYKYSDLGFYLFRKVIEYVTDTPLETFVENNFYAPLGLSTMTFNPRQRFPEQRLVPTEQDDIFRKQLLRGYVHDPGAAMLGGVSGHAGLFSDANDLAIILQMLLNRGEYAGVQYLNPTTVSLFTKRQKKGNRRGLGFDKPEIDPYKPKPTADDASPRTFGHSGFTGTCMWADPDYNLIYVFLSNRVHPSAENTKLVTNNVRTNIHQVIYDAIKKSENDRLANRQITQNQ